MSRRLVIAASLAVLAASARADDMKALKAYDAGIAAVQGGRFADAVTSLRAALAERKDGSFRAGVVPKEYAPSVYLAEAYLGLGDCAQARAALDAAKAAKVGAALRSEIAATESRVAACGGAAPASAPAPATVAVAAATAAVAPPPCADLPAAKQALRDGDEAQARKLASGCLAANASDKEARGIVDQVDALLAGRVLAARQQQGAGDLAKALATANAVLAVDPQNEDAKALVRQLEPQVAARGSAPAGATTIAIPTTSAPRPATAVAAAASAPVASAAETTPGIAAYFRGDLDASIEALRASAVTPSALTVLACALASRSLLEADPSRAEADRTFAQNTWRQVKAKNAAITLSPKWVSPRVRELLEGG